MIKCISAPTRVTELGLQRRHTTRGLTEEEVGDGLLRGKNQRSLKNLLEEVNKNVSFLSRESQNLDRREDLTERGLTEEEVGDGLLCGRNETSLKNLLEELDQNVSSFSRDLRKLASDR
ncbi:hypothetical protein E2C01_043363 [Portunus trituberculatus]|uniref:Uncharacterized protein n=1 Tax=Portunus trituberculatus TaxID=210409 RepID=A0A5B7FVI5_PORTR|nr:hypothetical protein [Portunus trituberculatus]